MTRLRSAAKRYALAAALGGPSADAQNGLRRAFSVRGLVESGLPSVVFVVAFRFAGTRPAAVLALAVALLMVLERLARRRRVNEAVSGIFGVLLAVALSAGTGDAKNFFLPEVVLGIAVSGALLASVVMGKPLLGVVLGAVAAPFKGWQERPVLRRAFVHITAVAGVWAMVKALILLSLYLSDDVELLAGAKLALGYPVLAVLVLYYMRVVKRALLTEAGATERTAP
jgi:intracellular septation protein A